MYNSLDKQSVKQNTPIVAIGGCGQVGEKLIYISLFAQKVNDLTYANDALQIA